MERSSTISDLCSRNCRRNTIGVYSYSKYVGGTGWRLGVIAVHEDNIFDKMIAKLPDADLKALDKRYGALVLDPRGIKFIDRIVADSRDVALNHTAGLALPQQVMMSLFSLAEMMDRAKLYQKACMEILHRRAKALIEGLGIEVSPNPLYNGYYGLIDLSSGRARTSDRTPSNTSRRMSIRSISPFAWLKIMGSCC